MTRPGAPSTVEVNSTRTHAPCGRTRNSSVVAEAGLKDDQVVAVDEVDEQVFLCDWAESPQQL